MLAKDIANPLDSEDDKHVYTDRNKSIPKTI